MKIRQSELEQVAVRPEQYPDPDLVEIAFAGRSNVGKSSLLNLLTGRRKLARVSGSPGKTRTINFYRVDSSIGAFRIVDLPGYGYAKVSRSVSESWGKMMDLYLERRENLAAVVQLVDIRHEPSAQDKQMHTFLQHYGLDGIVVATKADKVSRNALTKQVRMIRTALQLAPEDVVLPVSSLKRTGQEDLLDVMEQLVMAGGQLVETGEEPVEE